MGGGRWGPNYEVPYILPYIFWFCVSLDVWCVYVHVCMLCVGGVQVCGCGQHTEEHSPT